MSSLDILIQLKAEYDKDNVSALIGAGFSKNAVKSFPDWSELLRDAVEDMYGERFRMLHQKYTDEGNDNSVATQKSVWVLLAEIGNLEFVSKYLRFKGIGHEAIDAYIEERIKPVVKIGSEWKCGNDVISKDDIAVHRSLLECRRFRNLYTTNYDNLLEHTRDRIGIDSFQKTITSETDLSDSASTQAIVKLHGSLPIRDDEPYEFDGDHNLRYVIALEDYESYMTKHQGFSYLMRIAMLQSRFCLLGFSGSDPNYMLWLQWMKDVLDKAQQKSKASEGDCRVYLVLVDNDVIEPARQLFYKNHHVGVIKLTDSSCIAHMLSVLQESEKPEGIRDTLLLFFRYLSHESDIHEEAADKSAIDNYSTLWGKMYDAITEKQNINTLLSRIRGSRAQLSCVPSSVMQQYVAHELYSKPLNDWDRDKVSTFVLAAKDWGVMPSYLKETSAYTTLLSDSPMWQDMLLQESVCRNDISIPYGKMGTFMQVYYEAFNLNFDKMHTLLHRMKKSERENSRYFYMYSLVDRLKATEQMQEWLQTRTKISIHGYNERITYNRIVKLPAHPISTFDYTRRNYKSDFDLIDEEASRYKLRKAEIRPYGTITHSVHFDSGDADLERAMRVLNMLMDTGYTPAYCRRIFIDKDVWLNVFMQVFEEFPYPMLYYSACYPDEKLLRKIGQEYAYSETLYPILPMLLKKALTAIGQTYTPSFIKEGLGFICSELYIAVPDSTWYVLFRDNVLLPFLGDSLSVAQERGSIYRNICMGLDNLRKSEYVTELFLLLVARIGDNPKLISRLICEHLPIRFLNDKDETILETIRQVITSSELRNVCHLAYVLNHYKKCPSDLLVTFEYRILHESLDFAKQNPNSIVALANLVHENEAIERIKQELVLPSNIWDCGIMEKNGKRIESGTKYMSLGHFPSTWHWTESDFKVIFTNMIDNATLLEGIDTENNLFKTQYVVLLAMMMHFYFQHKSAMPEIIAKDFESAMQNVLRHVTGVSDKFQMLSSEDAQVLQIGQFGIYAGVNKDKSYESENDGIMILLARAMSTRDTNWSLIVRDLRDLLKVNPSTFISRYKPQLIHILRIAWNIDFRVIDEQLPTLYYLAVDIAKYMDAEGVNEPIVRQWIDDKMKNRFNR